MKIYSYSKDKQTNDNLVSILELNNIFTAMTRSDSKEFRTIDGAKKWLAKRGYETILDIEEIN